ncbi:kyphoscoliosis peptidase-like [Polypterus senegalus]|uniref:kyphoscoliosis peptidase-like n=1 Tax=Polypterus senegalus TaxID=55291 RepID=UPI001964FD2F|nr:kyphoscoliosis peptidase-like [Polypterus senegalus]
MTYWNFYLLTDELQKTELQKIRAIWTWIINNIAYDTEQSPRDPEEVFRRRKAKCVGQANLFKEMCRFAGIECVVISGQRHRWNAVCIEDRWHLLDVTWIKEEYFLTHPEIFQKDHTPHEEKWNLLNGNLKSNLISNEICLIL